MIQLYAKANCPNCKRIEAILDKINISYIIRDIEADSGALADIMMENILSAPVLRIDDTFFSLEEIDRFIEVIKND